MGKYKTIMIDPPWEQGMTGKRKVRPNQTKEMPYNTMKLKEIMDFPVDDFSEENCLMFLWTTDKFLHSALNLLIHWGFKKHCTFVWNKNTGVCPFSVQFCNEFCILAYRGKFKINKIGIKTWFNAKKKEHSRKPDEMYSIAEQLGDSPRIDIFSREKRKGWEQWGDEINMFAKKKKKTRGKTQRYSLDYDKIWSVRKNKTFAKKGEQDEN